MNKISKFITKLINYESLTPLEAEEAMAIMIKGGATPVQIATYLTAVKMQDINSAQIIGGINYFSRAIQPPSIGKKVYTLSFAPDNPFINAAEIAISLMLSLFDISIIKNFSSIPPLSPAMRMLKSAGYNFNLTTPEVVEIIQKNNIAFTESRNFYPKMIDFSYTWDVLEFTTIFDLLIPLIQQVETRNLITAATNYHNAITFAEALKSLGFTHAIIFYNEGGFPYFCSGDNNVIILSQNTMNQIKLSLPEAPTIDFKEPNSFYFKDDNCSQDEQHFIDFTSFNSAALLVLLKISPNFEEALIITKRLLSESKLQSTLANLVGITNKFLKDI